VADRPSIAPLLCYALMRRGMGVLLLAVAAGCSAAPGGGASDAFLEAPRPDVAEGRPVDARGAKEVADTIVGDEEDGAAVEVGPEVTAARALGQTCTLDPDCGSGACVDGVCCDVGSCPVCQACNLNGLGTCSAVSAGPTVACPDDDSNCTKGCDGAGNCAPAAAGTTCGSPTCMNGSDALGSAAHVGQYVSVMLERDECDGSSRQRAACQATTADSCPGQFICDVDATCRTSCSAHADCVVGYFCDFTSGVCRTQKEDGEACKAEIECQSRACVTEYVAGLYEIICGRPSLNDVANPLYAGDCNERIRGRFGRCPPSAVDCSADGSCKCGSSPPCPTWMVCVDGTCKVAGRHPCLAASDCISGTCDSGLCPFTPLGGPCALDALADSGATAPTLPGHDYHECVGPYVCEQYPDYTKDNVICVDDPGF